VREGTLVRTARREDLLRILVPASSVPRCEIRRALLIDIDAGKTDECRLMVDAFLIHEASRPVCIPFHGIRLEASCAGFNLAFIRRLRLEWAQMFEGTLFGPDVASHTVKIAAHEALVSGSGMVIVSGQMRIPRNQRSEIIASQICIQFSLPVVDSLSVVGSATLKPCPNQSTFSGQFASWS
jgi:hypothetical protein